MTTPTDGQAVSSTGTSIAFGGYLDAAGQTVSVQAREPSTGGFTQIATAVSATGSYPAWDVNWHAWTVNAPVPARFWVPGSTGATAVLRSRTVASSPLALYGVNQQYGTCLVQSETVNDFAADCTEPTAITICTSDFRPFGSRRSPCPRRAVVQRRPDGTDVFHTLPDTTTTFVFDQIPTSIQYRGDAVSFIDIFDQVSTSSGLPVGGANVVRIRYSQPRTSTTLPTFNPATLASSLGVPTPWQGARTVRQYDLGECSTFLDWRSVFAAILPALEIGLADLTTASAGTVSLRGLSRAELRPLLRADGTDAVRFVQLYDMRSSSLGDIGNVLLALSVRLSVAAGRLTATVEADSVVDYDPQGFAAIGIAFGLSSEASVEDRIRGQVGSRIPTAVSGILPAAARAVSFDRVHMRPDGVEFVLAEDTRDPQISTLVAAGLCSRPDPLPGGVQAGLQFSFFDPPFASDPRPLGDTRPPS